MKKILTVLFALTIFCCKVVASELSDISIIEKDIFGVEYNDETVSKRLNRIENNLYGKIYTGTTQDRLKRISDSSGISFLPKKTAEEKRIAQADYQKEDNTVSYPVIDMMESKIFNKTFQGENVYKRVARLETKTFGKSSDGELLERTDKLKANILAVKPDTITYDSDSKSKPGKTFKGFQTTQNTNQYSFNNQPAFGTNSLGYPTGAASSPSSYNNYYNNYSKSQDTDVDYAISAAENLIFGKTNTNQPQSERLNKLETKIFKKTYSGDVSTRLERIVTAASAQRNGYQYAENKWDKYISTGLQVGTILLMILAMIL